MKLNKLAELIVERELEELHVALPARILKYDPKKMIAEIEVLAKKKLGDKEEAIAPIVKVPVAHFNAGPFVIRPPYQKNDIVQVLFNERALDKLLISGEPEPVEYKRKHSLDDAVVIKGLKTESEADLPSANTEDLLLQNLDTDEKIFIKKDGGIRLGIDMFYQIVKDTFVPLFNGHTHPYTWGHDPGSGNTGSPNQSMGQPHLTQITKAE